MRSRRPPSLPPEIRGYDYLRLIGSGGFADVFLYQEHRPRRQVAIKVLLPQWSEGASREAFAAEADLMATVSSHPSIVTIFDSEVTDDGRLYLAMEYCSRPTLSARYKKEPLGIAETLRIGIQIAGAVETAHRNGIVHRDIKPANILVTDYGHPALTDFGISATIEQSEAGADGMSVPWSPPENLAATPRSGVTSDVWSLAATMYTLLAGRSPFEVPGGVNSQRALIDRIVGEPLPALARADVPASLEGVLAAAMAKEPDQRYPSMLDLGRALQQVQMGQHLAVTPIDIISDSPPDAEVPAADAGWSAGGVDGGTRVRIASDRFHPGYGVAHASAPRREAIPAGTPAEFGHSAPAAHSDPAASSAHSAHSAHSAPAAHSAPTATSTPAHAGVAQADPAPEVSWATGPATASGRWGRRWPVVAVAALVLGGVGGTVVYDRVVAVTTELSASAVSAPTSLVGIPAADGNSATFSWENPDPQGGDIYAYRAVTGPDEGSDEGADVAFRRTSLLTVAVSTAHVEGACLEVVVVREGRISADPARACLG